MVHNNLLASFDFELMDRAAGTPSPVNSGSSFSFEGFLASTVVAAVWLFYLIFINSRLWGFVVTFVLRKLVSGGDVHVGRPWFHVDTVFGMW